MALRAFISLRQKGESSLKKRGDVLCVKLAGGPIGRKDAKEFLVVDDWRDDDLEAELTAKLAETPIPVINYPYATYDSNGAMVQRSLVWHDVDTLPPPERDRVMNPAITVPPKRRRDITVRTRLKDVRANPQRNVWDGEQKREGGLDAVLPDIRGR